MSNMSQAEFLDLIKEHLGGEQTSRRGLKPGQAPVHRTGCAPNPEGRQGQLQRLHTRHHRMKQLHITGHSHGEIAEILGCSKGTVESVLNSELMKRELAFLQGALDSDAFDTAKELKKLNQRAVEVLETYLNDDSQPAALRVKIAMDNLSRTGFAPQVNVKGQFDHNHFTAADIEQLKRNALEAKCGAIVGDIVDAEFTEMNGPQASVARERSDSVSVSVSDNEATSACGEAASVFDDQT